MSYSITANITVNNPSKIEITDVEEVRTVRNDPSTVFEVRVFLELRSGAGDRFYGSYLLNVRNGQSDMLRLRSPWAAGMVFQEIAEVVPGVAAIVGPPAVSATGVATPTGMTDVLAAWRTGTTTARRNGTLTVLKNAGIIEQASIPGTVP